MPLKTVVAQAELETPRLTLPNLVRRLTGKPLKTQPTTFRAEVLINHQAGPEPRVELSVEGFTVVVDTPAVEGCVCEVLEVDLRRISARPRAERSAVSPPRPAGARRARAVPPEIRQAPLRDRRLGR